MKYEQPHLRLLYGGSLPFVIVAFLLVEFATPYLIKAFYFHWAALAIVILFCCLPFANQKLAATSNEKPRYSFHSWLIRLFSLQLSLFFVFIGIATVFTYWLPPQGSIDPAAISQSLHTFLKCDGLFPWALFALFAVRLGYVSYIQNQDAYLSHLSIPLFNSQPNKLIGMILNLQARLATTTILATSFAFMILLVVSLLLPKAAPFHPGFQIKTLVIITALILLGFSPVFKKISQHLLNPKLPLWMTLFTTLILFALVIWLLNALFFHAGQFNVEVPALIQWLERKETTSLWLIFSAVWWLAWTPLMSIHFARISQGYRIRSLMLAMLFLPALLTLLITVFPNSAHVFQHYPVAFSLVAILAFLYLLIQITEKTKLPMLIRSYLPRRNHYKRRDHYFYFRKVFQIMLIVIYLYLPAGMAVTAVLLFVLVFPFMLQSLVVLIASVKASLFQLR